MVELASPFLDSLEIALPAAVAGVVRGVGGLPLGDARVRVLGARGSAVSDARGRFSLGDLPSGTQVLEVRRIGYLLSQQPTELRGGRTVLQDVQLRRLVTLDSVRVLVQRSRYREFEFNRKANRFGRFFTVDSIEKRQPLYTSDLFRMTPGFQIAGFALDAVVRSSRGASSITPGWVFAEHRDRRDAASGDQPDQSFRDRRDRDLSTRRARPGTVHRGLRRIVIWSRG